MPLRHTFQLPLRKVSYPDFFLLALIFSSQRRDKWTEVESWKLKATGLRDKDELKRESA